MEPLTGRQIRSIRKSMKGTDGRHNSKKNGVSQSTFGILIGHCQKYISLLEKNGVNNIYSTKKNIGLSERIIALDGIEVVHSDKITICLKGCDLQNHFVKTHTGQVYFIGSFHHSNLVGRINISTTKSVLSGWDINTDCDVVIVMNEPIWIAINKEITQKTQKP